ncbi:hypothetical protein ABZW51_33290, partial [Streptomyces cellulosae]
MSTSQPDASRQSEDRATPDSLLHTRTGAEVSPEDLTSGGVERTGDGKEVLRQVVLPEIKVTKDTTV